MAQGQHGFADQETHIAAATADPQDHRTVVVLGDMLAVPYQPAEAGKPRTVSLDIKSDFANAVASEQWSLGQAVYRHAITGELSRAPVGPFFGWASYNTTVPSSLIVKPTGTTTCTVSTKAATVDGGDPFKVDIVIDPVAFPASGANGAYTIRAALPPGSWVSSVQFAHDGNLSPLGATLALGTSGDPVAIMAATDLTTLVALGGPHVLRAATANIVAADSLVLTVASGSITAGKLHLRVTLSPV